MKGEPEKENLTSFDLAVYKIVMNCVVSQKEVEILGIILGAAFLGC